VALALPGGGILPCPGQGCEHAGADIISVAGVEVQRQPVPHQSLRRGFAERGQLGRGAAQSLAFDLGEDEIHPDAGLDRPMIRDDDIGDF
jgi:hypothetical protein